MTTGDRWRSWGNIAICVLSWLMLLCPRMGGAQDRKIAIGEAGEWAVQKSQLTLPGSAPFHLKAEISAPANGSSGYKAEIEEFWVSPEKWRRTIQSSQFSQTLIVNQGQVLEQDTGDYYPFWLRNLVTAIFDPLPMLAQLKHLRGEINLPTDSVKSNACLDLGVPAGVAPVHSSLTYVFCFQGKWGLLQQVITPGYKAHFEDYRPFKGKSVARKITAELGPATVLEARIYLLESPGRVEDALFAVDKPTPAAEQLKSAQIGEDTARKIALTAPDIAWPAVREGRSAGTVSVYVSVDRRGEVREAWPLESTNHEVDAAACEQVKHWKFQPYVNGVPFQMESVLTFAYETKMGEPVPLLTNAEVRKLATRVVEAHVSATAAEGTKFTLRLAADEHGNIRGVTNPNHVKPALFMAGDRALRQWKFRPYIHNGRPDRFNADVTFSVK